MDIGDRAGITCAASSRDFRAAPGACACLGDIDFRIVEDLLLQIGLAGFPQAACFRGLQVGNAGILRGRKADMEVCAHRLCELFPENRADAAPVNPADDFPDKIALSDRMIAGLGAGLPERGLRSKKAGCLVPVIKIMLVHRGGPACKTG